MFVPKKSIFVKKICFWKKIGLQYYSRSQILSLKMGLKSVLFSVILIVIVSATLLIILPGIPPHIEPKSFE